MVLNVTTAGPNACFDLAVELTVECDGADTRTHRTTHDRTEETSDVTKGTSVLKHCEAMSGKVEARNAPKSLLVGTTVGSHASDGKTIRNL